MKIWIKYIIKNKKIKDVNNSILKLTNIIDMPNTNFKPFNGKVNENNFIFNCKSNFLRTTPKLKGKLIEKDFNTTLIKINICVSIFDIILTIFCIISIFYIIIFKIPEYSDNLIYYFVLILLLIILPITLWCIILYNVNKIIKNIKRYV